MMSNGRQAIGTDEAIRAALLSLLARKRLAEVTVSELAREAHVSRSTFYAHFGNVTDVYDSVIGELSRSLSLIMGQVACPEGIRAKGTPFCAMLREGGPYEPAVAEDRFLRSFLGNEANLEKHDLYDILIAAGHSPDEARAICAFQLAGCFTAARIAEISDDAWPGVKTALDRFILGGISACLAARRE